MSTPPAADYERGAALLIARIEAACEGDSRWPARLLRGCEAALSFLGEDAERARLLTGGVLALPDGLDRHLATAERLAALLRPARSHYPDAKDLHEDAERVLATGLGAALGARLRSAMPDAPLPLPADLAELALAPYVGASQARRAIDDELARRREDRKTLRGVRLPPAATAADQRRRIHTATIEEVLSIGLPRASVLRIAKSAEVSKATFYEHFSDKRESLWAAYEDAEARLRARIAAAVLGEPGWPAEVRAALRASLQFFAEEPQTLFLLTREGAAADERIAKRSQAARRDIAERLRDGRGLTAAALPDVVEQTLLESAIAMLRECLVDGDAKSLPRLAPQLTELLLAPYLGPAEAKRVAAAPAAANLDS